MQDNNMSNLFALGSRPVQPPSFHTAQDGGPAGAQNASASGKLAAKLPVVDRVSPSSSSITLSQQALNSRVDRLGDKTVEAAQRFIGNIAESLFGDAARGASFHLDSMSVAADISSNASSEATSNAAGEVGSAALQMNASASFIGRGTIATFDGQSFDFEIEVHYTASLQVSAGTAASPALSPAIGSTNSISNDDARQPVKAPDTLTLTGKPLPAIEFPGSLADLFKVLGRQLTVSANSGRGDGNGGDMSLRLLRLVNTAALLAPRLRADNHDATSAERNRALASYATPAAAGTVTTA
jgi:hypothetical protein